MAGEFKLILGPMASGKSRTLITVLEKYKYANKKVVAVHPGINVRDQQIESRNGLKHEAVKVKQLAEFIRRINLDELDVLGIDEAFMFDAEDLRSSIVKLLKNGKTVVASSLNIMGNGNVPPAVVAMLALAPDVSFEDAVCTTCDEMDGNMTLIFNKKTKKQITDLPDVVPDDGTLGYRPVCRSCYFGWK